MTQQIWGRILSASQIEQAATTTLQKWFSPVLKEIESQQSLQDGFLAEPRNYTGRNSYDDLRGEEIPKVVVLSPGLMNQPTKSGRAYRATWRLGIGVATAAPTEQEADVLVKGYAAAVRKILTKYGSLGLEGVIETFWVDESYDDLPFNSPNQLYKVASVWFGVDIDNVTDRLAGPQTPDAAHTPYGQVEKVFIDIEKEAIT